jgi:hypothetical protein
MVRRCLEAVAPRPDARPGRWRLCGRGARKRCDAALQGGLGFAFLGLTPHGADLPQSGHEHVVEDAAQNKGEQRKVQKLPGGVTSKGFRSGRSGNPDGPPPNRGLINAFKSHSTSNWARAKL